MNQVDFVGGAMPARAFLGQVTNTNDRVAEEKARLNLELGKLMNKPPQSVVNGSVQLTRRWIDCRKKAEKVAKSTRQTVPELQGAVQMMKAFL